jgi:hypothetical protein
VFGDAAGEVERDDRGPARGDGIGRKTRELMVEFGQGEELTVPLEEFRAADAMARIRLLEGRAEELTSLMRQRKQEFRAALAEQYELVFALVAGHQAVTATASS